MEIFPAIDIYEGKAVRLLRGDYNKMTVYNEHPAELARDFIAKGAENIHLVDLEGALEGYTPNIAIIKDIIGDNDLFCEVGGGIRDLDTIDRYLELGVDRVILGTAAITDEDFLKEAIYRYGAHIAVGVDVRNEKLAIKGWREDTDIDIFKYVEKLEQMAVETIICTDISRDGAMKGTSIELYKKLKEKTDIKIIASGGVSSMEDIERLKKIDMYGAIIGKAYYTGAINLAKAIVRGKA